MKNKALELEELILSSPEITGTVYVSPVGEIYLFGDNRSLKYVAFRGKGRDRGMARPRPRRVLPDEMEKALAFLERYFLGEKCPPGTLPRMDLSPCTEKEKMIYRALLKVPFGRTISYGELAGKAGLPGAARFTGNAMARNIFPIFIPCHRVILSDGTMGNYTGGIGIKKFLLGHEGFTYL